MNAKPVAEDALLDVEDVGELHAATADQLAEHDREDRAADRRWRVGGEVPAPGAEPERVADDGPVRGEVGPGDEAAAVPLVRGEGSGQVAGEQVAGAGVSDPVEGGREVRVDDLLAGDLRLAPSVQQERRRLGIPGEQRVAGDREVARSRRPEREPLAGSGGGWRDDLAPRHPPVALVGETETADGTRRRDAARTRVHGDPAAVGHGELDEPLAEPLRR